MDDNKKAASAVAAEQTAFFLQALIDALPCPVFYKDADGVYLGANEAFEAFIGRPREEFVGKDVYGLSPRELADVYFRKDRELFDQGLGGRQVYDAQVQTEAGERRTVLFHKANFADQQGRLAGLVGAILDVTDERRAQAEAEQARRQLQDALESIAEGFAIFDADDRLLLCSDSFAQTHACIGDKQSLLGRPYESLLRGVATHNALFDSEPALQAWLDERIQRHRAADDQPDVFRIAPDHWMQARSRRTAQGDLVTVRADISELKRKERELEQSRAEAQHLALHDSLTGLPNRTLLQSHLQQMQHQAEREGRGMALLYIDLDGFKAVNDSLGHQAGDACLQSVARRIADCSRASELSARIGGDEFAVSLLVSLQNARQQAEFVAQRLLQRIAQPLDVEGQPVQLGASIGIAHYPQDADSLESLIGHADSAMYAAKAEVGDCYRFFADLRTG